MCLPIDCWLCTPRTDDDHYHASPNKHGGAQRNYNGNGNGNGGQYYNGNGYPAHGAVAAGEADHRKVTYDVNGRRGPAGHAGAGVAATRGWHGHAHAHDATAAAQEKQADGTLKPPQPVEVDAAAGGAPGVAHNYYDDDERQQRPAHQEDTADYYYPAANATADHESPSEALGEK